MTRVRPISLAVLVVAVVACGVWETARAGPPRPASVPADLVGLWHASPHVAAGWNDRYRFLSDGTFRFEYSQYDGEKRVLDYSGRYRVSGRVLHLTVTRRTVLQGGRLEPAGPSVTSRHEIVGGRRVVESLQPARQERLELGPAGPDARDPARVCRKIGKARYWKASANPSS